MVTVRFHSLLCTTIHHLRPGGLLPRTRDPLPLLRRGRENRLLMNGVMYASAGDDRGQMIHSYCICYLPKTRTEEREKTRSKRVTHVSSAVPRHINASRYI
ncbi:Uncharacterized protein FWK35_00005395 [Aphis craccivora]|uniref:Uncharacterized protein n=1 Tax=Aphis craccivora TaxID=307492 RepID=A0A6G0ZED0_APHCR|nr:Uncharacterized protein FWK35_00005395 [Aphis craccivora]